MADSINEISANVGLVENETLPIEEGIVYPSLDDNGLATASGLLTVYNYHSVTGEYTDSVEEYVSVGVGIADYSTCHQPPEAVDGKARIFDGTWQLINDYRGNIVYSTIDGSARVVTEPGDYPAGTTLLKPATLYDKWNGRKWVTDKDARQAALIKDADSEKASRISEANNKTQAWQTQLLLGMIKDSDKAMLTEWMSYIQAVQAVETSLAPAISWPERPAE